MNHAQERTCDKCGKKYILNSREIPRLSISLRVDNSDISSKDLVISPDYCYSCFMYISFNFGKHIMSKLQKLNLYNNPHISR